VRRLDGRFAASRARNTEYQQREEAILMLKLRDRPAEALRLAKENWAVQHQPIDARLLLEAALRLDDQETVQSVLDWRKETKLEDVGLDLLARKVTSSTK
jgi:hypothetical protein